MDYQEEFKKLLETHLEKGYLRDVHIKRILEDIPLERILDEEQLKRFVLMDSPVPFYIHDRENIRTISAPHMISMMTSMMELNPTDNVLILGSKGGIIEAVIAKAVNQVYILEENEEVAAITEEGFIKLGLKNVWVRQCNPMQDIPEIGPFSKILFTGAVFFIPSHFLDKLVENGIIVVPLIISAKNHQIILQIIKKKKGLEIINLGAVIFSFLYYSNQIKIDITQDITFERVRKYFKDTYNDEILGLKTFFEEFQDLPRIEIEQIVFLKTGSINYSIVENKDNLQSKQDKSSKYNDSRSQTENLIVYSNNSSENDFNLLVEWDIVIDNQVQFNQKSVIITGNSSQFEISVNLPLKEGTFYFVMRGSGLNHYRLFHNVSLFHIYHNNDEWNYLIEL